MDQWDSARAVAREIEQKATSDPSYLKELHSDPVVTLRAAGMSDSAIGVFLEEAGLSDDEVQGYGLSTPYGGRNTLESDPVLDNLPKSTGGVFHGIPSRIMSGKQRLM
jgi:hypothetical protein